MKPQSTDITKKSQRISSIDTLRGLVMILMLVDHVRERFFLHMQILDPMSIENTSSELFFTRLTAHLCAPVFIFLTGLSAWLYEKGNPNKRRSASSFLLKRGFFLIFLELTLVNLSWFGTYQTLYLQVIWAIGVSMICLAGISKLPKLWVGIIGAIIVFGHNLLTPISFEPNEFGYTLWTILHDRGFLLTSDVLSIKASYPVLPWIGVISLGYVTGPLFHSEISMKQRTSILLKLGTACLSILALIRGANIYGETEGWKMQETVLTSIQSFLNFTKYPPSLDFILLTLGIAFFLLVVFEHNKNKASVVLKHFGAAPMFFYLVHLYVLLIAYKICIALFGANKGDYFGVDNVWQIWAISLVLATALYFPTKKFSEFKRKSSSKWIKYL